MQAVEGKLLYFYKDPYHKVPIFISGTASRCVLWIGGQAESFFTVSYFEELARAFEGEWSFAQMELPSSHIGYGAPDHFAEADDIDDILDMLTTKHGMKEIVLFATSTAVQLVLHLMANGRHVHAVTRVIMHGVVCRPDNEIFSETMIAKREAWVKELMASGRREDSQAMKGYYDLAVTPARLSGGGFLTLQEALWLPALAGDASTAATALGPLTVPTLIMLAHDAQYKPAKEDVERVVQTAKAALGCPEEDSVVQVFNDTCDEVRRLLKADIPSHVRAITAFLKSADVKREERDAIEAQRVAEEERLKRAALNKLVCA